MHLPWSHLNSEDVQFLSAKKLKKITHYCVLCTKYRSYCTINHYKAKYFCRRFGASSMSYRLLSCTKKDTVSRKTHVPSEIIKLLWWPAFSFTLRFRNKKSRISKTYDNSTRRCRRRNRCPDRTSTSNVCSDRSRTEIRPRYNSGLLGGEAKEEKVHVGVGEREWVCEKLPHYSAVCSAGEEKRVLSLTGTAEFVLAAATIPIAVALPLFRNAEPVVALEIDRRAGYDKKQNKGEAHGDEERSSDVAYRAQIERKRR